MRSSLLAMLLTLFVLPLTLPAQGGPDSAADKDAARQQKAQRGERARSKAPSADRGQQRQRGQRQPDPEKMFQRFDQNQDGFIAADELPERIRQKMLGRADTNADGGIDLNEFKSHLRKMMQQRGQDGQGLRGPMQRGAKNGQGQGNANGRPGQRANRPNLSFRDPEKLDAGQLMDFLDRSGDGVLQKSELPKMMAAKLGKIDADGDQVVSQVELRSAIEKIKARAMDAGKGLYSTDSNSSKGQVPKRPGSGG